MSNLEKINVLTKDKLDSLDLTQYPNQIFGTTDEVAEGGGSEDVEHIEVLYDKNDPTKQTIGGTAYTSGIIGTDVVSGADFSKYKRLKIYVSLSGVSSSYDIDLEHIQKTWTDTISNIYTGGVFAISKDKTNLLCHSSYVNQAKNTLKMHAVGYLLPTTTFQDRTTNTLYFIYKIEGVLA